MVDVIKQILQFEVPKENVVVEGWLSTVRKGKEVAFLEVNDGSGMQNLQAIEQVPRGYLLSEVRKCRNRQYFPKT